MYNQVSFPLEIKEASDNGTFKGYGSVFGVRDSDSDILVKGAFHKSLSAWSEKGKNPPMLWQHSQKDPIGYYSVMREDDGGLYVEGNILLDVQKGKEAYALLKNGVVTGLSIGFMTKDSEYDSRTKARMIKEVELFEVSLVTMPANDAARVSFVKAADGIASPRDLEAYLRAGGYSQRQAKSIVAHGHKGIMNCRDGDDDGADAGRDARECADLIGSFKNLQSIIEKGL